MFKNDTKIIRDPNDKSWINLFIRIILYIPCEITNITDYINKQYKLTNKPILILSGDRHIGGIYKCHYNNVIEVTSSSFNQNTLNFKEVDTLRVSNLIKKNNFGLLEIDNNGVKIKIISGFFNRNIEYASTEITFN